MLPCLFFVFMHWSRLFIPTLRETPAEADVPSHQLLLRAGYIRQLAPGIYNYLFLAQRSLLKIQHIIRREMEAVGAHEIHMPALQPAELWQQSGRAEAMAANLFRLRDRGGRDLCLGRMNMESVAALARGELRSYKQLPQTWFQIQTKFRDEARPKAGVLRARQFLMKEAYSFDREAAGLDANYALQLAAYQRILSRCGIRFLVAEAHAGPLAGSRSHEFMAPSRAGDDLVVVGSEGYIANAEIAVSRPVPPSLPDPEGSLAPEAFHTPGYKTIAEVAAFTGLPETSQMKSLVFVAGGKPVLVLLRGDHHMSEAKLQSVLGVGEIRPALSSEIQEWFGAAAGSLGPIGITNMPVLADLALHGRRNLIAGANRDDYHLRNVTPGLHFQPAWHDLRHVAPGDTNVDSGDPLELVRTIEIGHIAKLGTSCAEAIGLHVLDESGAQTAIHMGSYALGVERILAAAIEQSHDSNGMCLPPAIAPFDVVITPVNPGDPAQRDAADSLYRQCREAGLDPLLDDREERPGVKFKDADLIGVPYRLTIGKKLPQGIVEYTVRRTGKSCDVPIGSAVATVRAEVEGV